MADRFYLQGDKHRSAEKIFPGRFVFDANIWISINGPYEDHIAQRATAYSSFYKKALQAESEIYVPQLVATEFLNRSVNIQSQTAGFERGKGKIHQAHGYKEWIKEACDLLHAALDGNKRISDDFDELALEPCYQAAERGGLEFHDVLIVSLCRRHKLILVTDDADYAGQDIPIVTWNRRLI